MIKYYYNFTPLKKGNCTMMRTDLLVNDDSYVFTVELPGFNKEDLKVSLEEDILTIEAKRSLENTSEDYIISERYSGDLKRSFKLKDVREEDISAKYENGILEVRVGKLTEAETKKIITIE